MVSPMRGAGPEIVPGTQLSFLPSPCGRNIPPNPDAAAPAPTSRIVLSHTKDDATLNLQNVAAAAPSRFNEVGLYAPSQSQGLSPMNQQTVASVGSKTAASNPLETSIDLF
uniref:Uncharacterized protein n=1 Tax=Vitis vinifera TaxID=29760 RepID=A5BW17_VITVI|nr:hypothetical protein VITISV_014946 [Vitis vinifera]